MYYDSCGLTYLYFWQKRDLKRRAQKLDLKNDSPDIGVDSVLNCTSSGHYCMQSRRLQPLFMYIRIKIKK